MRLLKIALLIFFVAPVYALGQESQSCSPPVRYVVGSNVQNKIVRVRKINGIAYAAFGGTDERHEIAAVTGVCLGLYSVPEGQLLAKAETSASSLNHGDFVFRDIPLGRYRLVSVLSPKSIFAPIDAPVEVVRWPLGGVFSRAKIYLHFRFLRSGVPSYASTTTKRASIKDVRSYTARHNNPLNRTRN
jgi:hypothetical protein